MGIEPGTDTPIPQVRDDHRCKQWEDGPGEAIEEKPCKQPEQANAKDEQPDSFVSQQALHLQILPALVGFICGFARFLSLAIPRSLG
jgi:hypothetical protein